MPAIFHHASLMVYLQNSITGTTSATHKQPPDHSAILTVVDPTTKTFHTGSLYKRGLGKVQDDLQQLGHQGALQRKQYHLNFSHCSQG